MQGLFDVNAWIAAYSAFMTLFSHNNNELKLTLGIKQGVSDSF